MRRAVPWVLVGALAVACARVLVRAATTRVGDPDVWWIAAAGRSILATGHVPRANAWSFVEPDQPWVMHEWLFGPPYAVGLAALGPPFFALVAAGAFLATGAMVVSATLGRTRHAVVGCAAAAVPLVLFAHATARPTWVSLVLPASMAALALRDRLGPAAAVACVLLELVWANAHGSFPVGVLVLFAGALAGRADRGRRLAAAGAGALATLANPYGVRLHALVASYALGARADLGDLGRLVEYAPVWEHAYFFSVSPAGLGALLALVAVALAAVAVRTHRARGLLVVLLAPMAALHARSAPLVAVVAAIALVPVLDDVVDRTPLARWLGGRLPVGRAALGGAVLGAATVAGIAFAAAPRPTRDAWIDPGLGGESFVRLAAELPDGAPTVTPFGSAGLLVWLAEPRGVRVLYDSRNDCYSPAMRRLGLTLHELPPDALVAALEARGARWALVPSPAWAQPFQKVSFDRALSSAPGWTVHARDGDWCLYARRAP